MISGLILFILLNKNIASDTMRLPVNRGRIVELTTSALKRPLGIFITPTDDFNVRSCSNGKVQSVWQINSRDYAAMISSNDTFYTYAQMDTVLVNPGQYINRGDLIGERKMIRNDYNSIIFIVLKGDKELNPERFIIYQK